MTNRFPSALQNSSASHPLPGGDEPPGDLSARVAELESEIRELQHRAKNSLQLVLSLLRLQSGRIRDPDARLAFEHTVIRVESLAVLYRQLHEQGNGVHLEARRFLGALCENVRQSLPNAPAIPIVVSGEPVLIGLYEAMPLGLIVAELIINGMQHAFPPNPWIRVAVSDLGNGRARLTVEDNGRPLPVGFDADIDENLMLAEALSLQLGDTLVTDHDAEGTRSTVTFPI